VSRLPAVLVLVVALFAGCGGGDGPSPQLELGRKLLAEGKYEAAAVELKKATEADRHSLEAWLQLGHAYAGMKRYDEALAAYVAAKKIDRHSVPPFVAHAKAQLALGHIEQATTELNLVVEMDPRNLEALLLLAQVSQLPVKLPDGSVGVSRASLERAELNLQAAAALAPQDAVVVYEQVRVAAKLGKRDEAAAALKRLTSLAQSDAAAKKLLADAEQALKAAGG